ncbi:MAG: C25 family cysteine peptidase, partial [Clostridiales bacterium]
NMMNHAAINYDLKGIGASTKKSDIMHESTLSKATQSNSQNAVTSVVTRVTDINTLKGANAIPVDYLIITHSSLFNSNSLTTLANFRKDHNGLDVAIVKVDDIYGLYPPPTNPPATTPQTYISIRNFIKDVYLTGRANNTFDGHLGYILLLGDAYLDDNNTEMVPAVHSPNYYSLEQGGDYYYACTGGDTDDLMDLMYGRLSVGNETELSNSVNKIISYENNSNNSWCNDYTFVGGNPDLYCDSDPAFKTLTEIVPPSNAKSYAYRAYDTSPATQVIEASPVQGYRYTYAQYNDGAYLCGSDLLESWLFDDQNAGLNHRVHTFIYEGHGGWNALVANEGSGRYIFRGNTLDSKLSNDLYTFMILNCCDAGHFDNNLTGAESGDCLGEEVVYLANKGAIGCLASTRDSDTGAFGQVDALVVRAMQQNMSHVMGEAVMESKLLLSDSQYRRQYNLYGDPAVNLWPTGFTMTENTTLSGNIQISENLTVPSGVTLTIAAGANLRFSNGASITVNGNLVANGTSSSRITFQRTGTSGSWGNIILDGLGVSNSTLNNIDMSNGTELRILNGAKVTVSNCTLNNFYQGIYIYNADPMISGNQIINPNQNGIYGEASGKSPVIIDNVITKTNHSGQGIYLGNSTTAYVAHNDISGCDYGVYFGGSSHAYFTDKSLNSFWPNNRFTNNNRALCAAWGGYISGGSTDYNSWYNTIKSSVNYDAYAYQSGTIIAQYNYWGDSDPRTCKDGTSTIDVSNVLYFDTWEDVYDMHPITNTDNSLKGQHSLSKINVDGSDTDPIDMSEGMRLEKDCKLNDAISWYKSLINSNKYQSFAITELMRMKNRYSKDDILSYLEDLSKLKKNSYLLKVLGDNYLQNDQIEKAMSFYDNAISSSVSEKEALDAKFSKLFALINVKKDIGKAKELISEIKKADLSDFYFSSRVQTAENLTNSQSSYSISKNQNSDKSKQSSENSGIVTEYALSQNYPNPFNPSTTINFDIPNASKVSLKVYDILGKEVAVLVDGYKEMGRYSVQFNASDLPSGMYIYEIRANNFIRSGKMMLLK